MPRILRESHPHPQYPTLHLDLRSDSRFFQARAYLDGTVKLKSTKTTSLPTAYRIAEDWYRKELRGLTRKPMERLASNPTMAEVYAAYQERREERQRLDAEKRWGPIQHFWRGLFVAEVTSQTLEDFYAWRRKRVKGLKPHTLHKDVVLIRQVLKYAIQKGHITQLPFVPKVGKIESNPRPWLTKAEWEQLRDVAEGRIEKVAPSNKARQIYGESHPYISKGNPKLAKQRRDTWEFAAFMVASMCRVEELQDLQFFHCTIEEIEKRKILRCEFKGKTGMRVAYAAPEAVKIYEDRLKRAGEDKAAFIFPEHHRDAFRELLIKAGLYEDHFGNKRNYKALRATSIALALLRPNPPTIYQIALNAGTSVAVIEKFYAKRLTAEHGKDVLTASDPLPTIWGSKSRRQKATP